MMNNNPIKIVLIDNYQLFREGMRRIFEDNPLFFVVAEGETRHDALKLVKKYRPDMILLDINAIESNSMLEIKTLSKHSPNTRIVILSEQELNHQRVTLALKRGVQGYLFKEMNVDLFISAIKSIYSGMVWLHPNVSHYLAKDYHRLITFIQEKTVKRENEFQRPLHLFTLRECEVLELLVKGKSNQDIANELCITESTVKNHVRNILGKMHVNDRTNAVVLAFRNGWVQLENKNLPQINDNFI